MPCKKYYFLGELGYFIQVLLGALERHFDKHPEEKLVFYTFADYGKILRLLFPHNIYDVIEYEGPQLHPFRVDSFLKPNYPPEVDSFIAPAENIERLLRSLDYKGKFYHGVAIPNTHVCQRILKRSIDNIRGFIARRRNPSHDIFKPLWGIKKPLFYGLQFEEKRYICIFPRNRGHNTRQNAFQADWLQVIGEIILPYIGGRYQCVQMGLPEETLRLDIDNIMTEQDVYQQIHCFNNAMCLFSSLSGLGQFASYSNCHVCYLTTNHSPYNENLVRKSNPFNKIIEVFDIKQVKAHPHLITGFFEKCLEAEGNAK